MASEGVVTPPQANGRPNCRCEGSLAVGAINDVGTPAAAATAAQAAPARDGRSAAPKAGVFGVAAILGALGTGLCCLAPALFPLLGLSTVAGLTALTVVTPCALFAAMVVLGLAFATVIRRHRRRSSVQWAILAVSTVVVAGLLGYSVSLDGLPVPW